MNGINDFVKHNEKRILEELKELLSIPSISTDPEYNVECRRAATWLVEHLRRIGFVNVELLADEDHPVVLAENEHEPGRPSVLVYGHYDVQPPDPIELWNTPPFEPTLKNGNLHARGTSDDKGQFFAIAKALENCLTDGLDLNVRLILEGQEESGSQVLTRLLQERPELVDVDTVLVSDMPFFAPGYPAIYTSLRGICYAEISVRTLEGDLHSGNYGGVAPNAHEALVRILNQLKTEAGRIRVPGIYEAVERPPKSVLEAWKKLPFRETKFRREEVRARELTGLKRYSPLERLWALPTFEIHGIKGGFTSEGAKTVIPAEATAKVSLRLVPNQKESKVRTALKRAVKEATPSYAKSSVSFIHGGDPVLVDTDAPVFDHVNAAWKEVVGREAFPVRAGGSIPIVPELGKGGANVVLSGIGLPDDGLHAPNEKIAMEQFWNGVKVFGRLFRMIEEDV